MDEILLERLGVVEITGGEVFGGEVSPWLIKLGVIVTTAVVGAVAANWDDFKDGLFDGYNDGTH